jgi:hypothetical protein
MVGERLNILQPNASRDHDRRGKIWYNSGNCQVQRCGSSKSCLGRIEYHCACSMPPPSKWQHTDCQTKNRTAPLTKLEQKPKFRGTSQWDKEPSRSWKNYSNGSVRRTLLLPNKSMPHLSGHVQNR